MSVTNITLDFPIKQPNGLICYRKTTKLTYLLPNKLKSYQKTTKLTFVLPNLVERPTKEFCACMRSEFLYLKF